MRTEPRKQTVQNCPCAEYPEHDCSNYGKVKDGATECTYFNPAIGMNVHVKDYTRQKFDDDDGQDFQVRTIKDEKLIDSIGGMDDEHEFEENIYNYGEIDDLPDSDRSQSCRTLGIGQKKCFDK